MRTLRPLRRRGAALARWLGLDRNALRRRTDRVESAVRVVAILLFAGTLVGAAKLGTAVYTQGLAAEASTATNRYQTTAVLSHGTSAEAASTDGVPATSRVRATWHAPDGTTRAGILYLRGQVEAGDHRRIWVDVSGRLTTPPQERAATVANAMSSALGLVVAVGLTLVLSLAGVRLLLNRARFSRWDAEWLVASRKWTRRR